MASKKEIADIISEVAFAARKAGRLREERDAMRNSSATPGAVRAIEKENSDSEAACAKAKEEAINKLMKLCICNIKRNSWGHSDVCPGDRGCICGGRR